MPKLNLRILIIIIAVLIVIIPVSLYLLQGKKLPLGNTTLKPYPTNVLTYPNVLLSFSPNAIHTTPNSTITSNLVYDVGKYETSGLIVNLSYDPKKVANVRLVPYSDPTSALSNSLEILPGLTAQDPAKGTVSVTYSLKSGIPQQKGRGIIGKLTATATSTPTVIMINQSSTAATHTQGVALNLGRVNLEIN